jgi:hypothetical protein
LAAGASVVGFAAGGLASVVGFAADGLGATTGALARTVCFPACGLAGIADGFASVVGFAEAGDRVGAEDLPGAACGTANSRWHFGHLICLPAGIGVADFRRLAHPGQVQAKAGLAASVVFLAAGAAARFADVAACGVAVGGVCAASFVCFTAGGFETGSGLATTEGFAGTCRQRSADTGNTVAHRGQRMSRPTGDGPVV